MHMQSRQAAQAIYIERRKEPRGGVSRRDLQPQRIALDRDIVERAAKALFEFVFSYCDRLDAKHRWSDCDEATREGFRGEAAAVIEAAWPLISGGSPSNCRERQ